MAVAAEEVVAVAVRKGLNLEDWMGADTCYDLVGGSLLMQREPERNGIYLNMNISYKDCAVCNMDIIIYRNTIHKSKGQILVFTRVKYKNSKLGMI